MAEKESPDPSIDADKPENDRAPIPGRRYLALKTAMMPRDTNKYGTIFGGVVLSYIDLAGAIGARQSIRAAGWAEHSLVTVALDRVDFLCPVLVGDTVSFWTEVTRVGRTSISVHVAVETDRDGRTMPVTDADATYVAVEQVGNVRRPIPIQDSEPNP